VQNEVFSPDSRRVGYVVLQDVSQHVVFDEQVGDPFDGVTVGTVTFSPDSNRTAFVGRIGQTRFAVVDGKIHREFTDPLAMTFSPDSQHVVLAAKTERSSLLVVDEMLVFEADTSVHAGGNGIIFDSANTFHFLEIIDGTVCSVDVEL
jgi:hypothetical protein